jgi:hypothetical protein
MRWTFALVAGHRFQVRETVLSLDPQLEERIGSLFFVPSLTATIMVTVSQRPVSALALESPVWSLRTAGHGLERRQMAVGHRSLKPSSGGTPGTLVFSLVAFGHTDFGQWTILAGTVLIGHLPLTTSVGIDVTKT